MSTSSITTQNSLSALYAASQTSAASSASVSLQTQDVSDDSTIAAAADGNLTGSTTASLNSQTMQALLSLTQGSDPSQGTQGAHHHHHHGGGQPPQQSDASTASSASTTSTS